jgi:hypothetical protein
VRQQYESLLQTLVTHESQLELNLAPATQRLWRHAVAADSDAPAGVASPSTGALHAAATSPTKPPNAHTRFVMRFVFMDVLRIELDVALRREDVVAACA